ncbi:adhesin [Pseudomonas brassicacearum]|uniref:Adhesin n=1 Tax=Pseudomonas brassicacearum TaxID=930166 RepID=A0A423GV44_9PSED|nr:filamentous hemagglutinin N-terminal domain-containing protein [Pseudomonas brassicacearum]RON01519.1 adhesin [Pseudomonas brassicacearum]
MDVRQLAFLAGQPSAAVIPRERFMGMPKRGLAFLLANVMFWQPMWAQADGIVVSAPGTSLDRAGNGVPIVNIATPNATGLSHNQFHDYNVTLQGLILNNGSTQTSATQLGGYIVGNPNLKNSGSAQTILNEVNGGSPSQLNGYTEVAGQSARVIVANPYGISCNGCGFINTPRVTLTTGKPVLDNGRLDRFQVDQGSVSIDGAGLNATNVDRFEIITRSAKINAQIQANNLTIVAGRNDVNAESLNATARADDGSAKPELAIDSSALGGMYAGAIKLVGTEAGVGVKLDGKLIASGGDIQLDANGSLSLVDTSAANGAVTIKAASLNAQGPVYAGSALNVQTQGDLSNQQSLAARDSINLSAGGQLTNSGVIEAGVNADTSRNASGDVNLSAQNLNNSGKSVVASRNLTVNTAQTLSNQGGTLSAQSSANITAGTLDNQNHGRVLSSGSLNLNANQLLNAQGGLVTSNGALLANVGALSNGAAEISSLAGVTLNIGSLDNVAGLVSAGSSLNINASGAFNNQRGRLAAQQSLQVTAASLDNSQQGSIISQGTLGVTTLGALDNHQAGTIQSTGSAVINSGSLDNHQAGVLTSSNALNLSTGQVDNSEGGRIASAMALTASVSGLDQHNLGQLSGATGLTLDLNNGVLNNQNALITTPGALLLKNLNTVVNQSGEISSQQGFTLAATSLDNSAGGKVLSEQNLTLLINQTLNNFKGQIASNGLEINANSLLNTTGVLSSQAGMNLTSASLDNSQQGNLYGKGPLSISTGALQNQSGQISSDNTLNLTASQVDNSLGGRIASAMALTASVSGLDQHDRGQLSSNTSLSLDLNHGLLNNQSALITTPGALLLKNLNAVANQSGEISSNQGFTLAATSLDNRGGQVSSQSYLTLTGSTLDNSNNGRLLAGGDLNLTATQVNNSLKGQISGQGAVQLRAAQLDNSQGGNLYAKRNMGLTLSAQLLNNQGALKGDGAILLSAGSLNNDGGTLTSVNALNLNSQGLLSNLNGQLTSGDTLDLISGQLNNGALGQISSAKALTASVSGLDQQNGKLFSNSSVSLDLNNGQLNNQHGLISGPEQLLLKNLNGVANQDGEISSNNAFSLTATSLDNTRGKVISSQQGLTLRISQALNNTLGVISAKGIDARTGSLDNTDGTFSSAAALLLDTSGALTNLSGELSSAGTSTISAASLDNRDGGVVSDLGLSIDLGAALDNRNGTLGSKKGLSVSAASLDNRNQGRLISDGNLSARITGKFDNQSQGALLAKGDVDITTGSLDNRGGSLKGSGLLTLRGDSADNRGSLIHADKALQLFVGQLDNRDKGLLTGNAAIGFSGTRLDNQGGLLSAVGPVSLKADEVANAGGRIASQTDLSATIGALNQQGGVLVAQGNLTLTGSSLDNRNGGLVGTKKALNINVDRIDNRAGELSSTDTSVNASGVKLTSQRLDNSAGGKVLSGTGLELNVAQLINQTKGLIHAQDSIRLSGSRLDNSGGTLDSSNALDITLDDALLNSGVISGQAGLSVHAASVDNSSGKLTSAGALAITSSGALINQGATLFSGTGMTLQSASLDNSRSGQLAGIGPVRITTGALDNSQDGSLTSSDTLDLTATGVSNGAGGTISSEKALTANVTGLDQQGGGLFSKTALSLDLNHGQLNNQGGYINAPGNLLLKNLNGVANQNGEISSTEAFILAAQNLDNSHGKLVSNQGPLTLRIAQALNNTWGVISAAAIDSRSDSLDNSNGLLNSHGLLDLGVSQALNNQSGVMTAEGSLLLSGASLDNSNGSISGKRDIVANVTSLNNQNGLLIASTSLDLTGSTLDNRKSGLLAATKALKLNVGSIDNRGGELSTSSGTMTLLGQKLDNSDSGKVIAEQDLNLGLGQVKNVNGLLNGKVSLSLDGDVLNNLGGSLFGLQKMRLTLSGDLDNSQGLISSEGALDVTANNLSNNAGKLSSAGALNLVARGDVHNQGGKLVTDSSLTLNSASLDNRQNGSLKSKAAMVINTGALDNSQAGRLDSDDTLDLTAGQVTNQAGGSIGSINTLTANVRGLDQQNSKLFSNTSLALNLNHGQLNNQGGFINAPLLLLSNLNGVNNQGGEISSPQAYTLAAANLDNSNGKVLGNQALTLRVNQALTNLKGQIAAAALDVQAGSLDNSGGIVTSRSDFGLTVNGLLSNQNQGLINAAQALTINSADINNQGGQLLGVSAVNLNAMALDNSANGLINSKGGLILKATSLNSSNGGELSAKGDIDLALGALTQRGGRLLGDNGIRLDLAGGDLDNSNGLLTAQGPLSISRLRDLNNQSGELSSIQSFNLTGRTLDNTGGKLISNNLLGLSGETLLNQGGLISGWQGLSVNGSSLDNRSGGALSSRSGNLDVTLSGALLNSGAGALVSQNALTVNAASLDNSAGIISSGAGQRLSVSGLLNNAQGGSIDSGAALTLNAMALSNIGGGVSAQQALNVSGTSLDNSNGRLFGNGAVTLDLLGALSNSNGKLASGGPLVISRSTQINNQGGQLVSQGLLNLLTGGLDNRNHGTVAASDSLIINASGAVQNSSDGLIYSQNGDLQLQAASLANGKGTLQSLGATTVTVGGDIDNQSGRLLAQNGDLLVTAANLDNRGGILASLKGALEARVVGVLKNGYDLNNNRQGGITQAQRLTLSALGGIDNYGGRISAQSGDAIVNTGSAGNFDNRNGGLYAKGLVKVSGNNFDNSGDNDGQIAGNRIDLSLNGALNNRLGIIESDSTLSVRAASLDNQTGQLRALGTSGKTEFQIGGLFDNRNGTLETANSDLTLGAGGFMNVGGRLLHVGTGTFDIATANVMGAGGTLVTRGGLTLNADSWTNSSVIQAGRLTVNVNNFSQSAGGQLLASNSFVGSGGNWYNDGLIASDGSLNLSLGGTYNGNGRVSSLGNLGLSAGVLSLSSAASIAGGGDTWINVGGWLGNAGRLTSSNNLTVTAGGVYNTGTLGSGNNLTVSTGALVNNNSLISSGGDMQLLASSVTNSYAQIYSLGNMLISRDSSQNKADLLNNRSGSIESVGNLTIAATTVNNVMDVLQYTEHEKSVATITELPCALIAGPACDYRGGGRRNGLWEIAETDRLKITLHSEAASINSGANLTINAGEVNNISSSLTAAGDLTATASTINNKGVQEQEIESTRRYVSWVNETATAIRLAGIFTQRNNPTPSATVEADMSNFLAWMGETLPASTRVNNGESLDAIIQAGANVTLNAAQNINNSVVRPYYAYVAAGRTKTDTGAGPAYSTPIYVNAQLPPNLAQQQVNPLSLPGFSLPTGQNGLFRLSGQGGTVRQATQANNAPQSWTMGGASVSSAQREINLPNVQARSVQIGDIAQVSASDRQLVQTARQSAGVSASGSAINVTAPSDSNIGNVQLPGHDRATDTITQSGVVHVDAASQPPVDATHPDLSLPTLPATQRDPLTGISVPGAAVPPIATAPAASTAVAAIPVAIAAVTSTPATSQTVARVQGLPDTSGKSNPQKYLIETNPVLTDLKQFMSSDYLLANLGYDPDKSAKRLGDGFYEQRLLQQAVVARTGQRFIDGQNSDEKLYKYLMDNAIASKQQLNLAVGVTLTAQQVAALTHDIVWMENATVNGETVLVPVLYLANANNRLAPNGALIAGNDVSLIAGADLNNVGTLRATNNLSAAAGNNLVNSGLIEAGNRLDLLAGNNIVNKAGGIIAGRDVSLTALRGDVINERSVTTHNSSNDSYSQQRTFVDSAARIEAANNLSLQAGRDVSNNGSVLQSGGDTAISAGRDITIAATESRNKDDYGSNRNSSSVTQYGATVSAGRDLQMNAGRDLSAIASQIEAKRDIALAATENLTLASAADESHSYFKNKKETRQEDHAKQISSTVTAGGSVALSAGKDLTLISSRVSAGDEAYLVAGDNLQLLAAQDSDYSLYDMKKKGSWGSSKTQRDEVTQVTNVGSEIKTGGDLTLKSGGDQKYQAAKLESGKDITLDSGGSITFEGVKDLHQESHEKSDSDLAWNSAEGKGNTDETLRQSKLVAQGNLVIKAVDGLHIDVKQINQNTVSQTIDAMVKADPQLAWLKDAEKRGDVDWRQIKEVHDSFKYDHSGLGAGAMLAIIIIVTVLTAGAASTAVASASTAMGASAGGTMAAASVATAATATTAATAATAAGLGNVIAASVLTSMASTAAVSAINNKGNLGATFKDVTSSDSLKGYVLAGATAGIASQFGFNPTELKFDQNIAIKIAADSVAKTAIMGGSLKDNLIESAVGTGISIAGAIGANKIGDVTLFENGKLTKVAMHAALGGLMAEAMGGDFRTGALAAGANEAVVDFLADKLLPKGVDPQSLDYQKGVSNLLAASQLVGVLTAAVTGGDPSIAANVTLNATQYNYLNHVEMQKLAEELKTCKQTNTCDGVASKYFEKHLANEQVLKEVCAVDKSGCQTAVLDIYNAVLGFQRGDYDVELPPDLKRVVDSFHQINIDASAAPTATIAMPSAEAFIQALGLDPSDPRVKVSAAALATLIAGKASSGLKGTGGTSAINGGSVGSNPIWSSTSNKSAVENAFGHWDKHKGEFPELQNSKQYVEQAKDFLINSPGGTLTKTNSRGDTLKYDPNTNTFGVLGQDGAPRTMFRPKDGINYWNRQ